MVTAALPHLVMFRPKSALTKDFLVHPAVESVLPDAVAIFGTFDREKQEFDTLKVPREDAETIAVRMLTATQFSLDDLMSVVVPGQPIFTNEKDHTVAALLLAPKLSCDLRARVEPMAEAILAVFPSATRVLWTPIDTPQIAGILRALARKGRDVEDEFLSDAVMRFDGERWTATD